MDNRDGYNFNRTQKTHEIMTKKEKTNHDKAVEYYKSMGIWIEGMVLHHMDPTLKYTDPGRYHEWRIGDVVPMTVEQHLRLHMSLRNPLGHRKSDKHREAMKNGHRMERRECRVMIHRVVEDGVHGVEAYVYPSCAEAARHIGCSLQLVYQTASRTQRNRRAKGWRCDYVPKSVSLGKVAEDAFDKVRALVA